MIDERQRELYVSFARAGVRSARRRLRQLRRPPRPADLFVLARVGDYELRLLRPTDGPGWTASMRANESRMRPWWPPVEDWQKATDSVAFADHYLQWRGRTRAGTGLCAVVAGPDGVLGELTLWNLTPGGTTGEVGVWLYPRISRKYFLPLWAAFFDNALGNLGLERLTSPVAVGNSGPLRLIEEIGGQRIATLPGYAMTGGVMADHDLYTLARDLWVAARSGLYARHPWPTVTDQLPDPCGGRGYLSGELKAE